MQKMILTINGVQQQLTVDPDTVLIDVLREDLHLTGTKEACDRKGQCGACTVLVDGKAVRSCLTKVAELGGASVITAEGLGTPQNPHLIQEAFALAGAIQCGFCTPGMIMTTKALLDRNPNPDLPAIKRAFSRVLCRCTGYTKIIDAIKLAGGFIRQETTPEQYRHGLKDGAIGVSHPRPSAMLKACGLAQFAGDIQPENALELAVVRSTQHHAVIKSIDTTAASRMPGVVGFMNADDVKGTNRIRVSVPDQPVLCEDRVRTYGDPIIAVAAQTRSQARAAAAAVRVEYEPLPVMMTPAESLAPGAMQIHSHSPNLCYTQPLVRGDAEKALAGSAAVVEAEFTTQTNHQAPLEPEACVAYLEGEGEDSRVVIIGRSIAIHFHAAHIQEAIGCKKIRYQEPFSGGQFGIKMSVTTEAIAGAAAMHFNRPVRYIPTTEESFALTTKRHAYWQKMTLAADADGRLSALVYDFTVDKGAYTMVGPVAMMRSLHMLTCAYHIPNIKASGQTAYTNNSPGGAARGAGPPQTIFALESLMDMLAAKLGMDPLEFRRKNSLQPGQEKATGMVASLWPFPELCDSIRPQYEKARKEASAFNALGGPVKRGVGMAATSFGIGGAGDAAKLAVEIDPDDGITIYAAVADPGEGNDAMLAQMAAHALDLPLDKVRLYTRDTDQTVGMGPAAGSRITWMAGGALLDAIGQLNKAMDEAGAREYAALKQAGKPTRYEGTRKNAGVGSLDPKTGQGPSFVSEAHNIQMAEVEVNTETGAVQVLKMTTVVDSGPVINPQSLEGQLEGGMDQGVGYALREEYIHGKTKDWVTFKFPTIHTSFEVETIAQETPRVDGPLGATGIGELTMVSTAPAVINAITDACGARIFKLPATRAKVKSALAAVAGK